MNIKELSIIKTIKGFSITEKIAFYLLALIFVTTGIGLLFKQADFLSASVPAYGGSIHEGIVGYPRYINPVLSITEAGKDLTSLIYAGLLRENGDGTLSTNLAENYEVSEDGLTYDVYLKKDLSFHDGTPLTADDVLFTIEKIKDPNIKSPEFVNWQGVTVEKIDDHHIQFTLRSAYAPFAYNLTLGILPKHIWENINNDQFSFSAYNYEPIGAGPYEFVELKRDQDGLPMYYKLKAFEKYSNGRPYIQQITLSFFKDFESAVSSLKNGKIDILGALPSEEIKKLNLSDDMEIKTFDLLRIFAVFLNQNQSEALLNREVRQALNGSIDRRKIIDSVMGGLGTPIFSPLPIGYASSSQSEEINSSIPDDEPSRIEAAKKILTDNGWNLNAEGVMEKKISDKTLTLSFTLSTSDTEELVQTAELLKEMWSKIGARVEIETYDAAALNQNIIRPRKYEALLFGEVVGHDVDLYPFWHSSQRNDPGLNVAMYTNVKADEALEKGRRAASIEERMEAYNNFITEIEKDIPAVFLYSPQYAYIAPKRLKGASTNEIETSADRFDEIEKKYIEEKKVLKIFNN